MNDKNKTDDADEPIDAEFETLDVKNEGASSGAHAGENKRVLRFGSRSLVFTGVVVIALFAVGYVIFKGTGTPENHINAADIASLSTKLGTLQGEMNILQSREKAARQKITVRLSALESAADAPVNASADARMLADLQTRLEGLENAEPALVTDPAVLAELTQRLEQVEQRVRAAPDNETDNGARGAVQARLSALENASPRLAPNTPAPATLSRLGTLESQLAALQSRLLALETQAEQKGEVSVLLLRIMALDDAAQSGAPFAREWQSVSQLLPQNTDVQNLVPLARTGVPGRAALTRSFVQHTSAIHRADENTDKKPGVMTKTRRAFGGLVSVRRIDGRAKGVDLVLAQTEAALEKDNLRGAVQMLGQLDGKAAQAAQGWLTQAQARLTLEAAITRLKSAAAEANP